VPGIVRPVEAGGHLRCLREKRRIARIADRIDRPFDHLPPVGRFGEGGEIGPNGIQARFVHPGGQARSDRFIIELMEDPRVELSELGFVEPGGRAAESREIERRQQRRGIGLRLDRFAGTKPGEQRHDRLRLDPRVAEMIGAERAEALGKLAFRSGQQRFMREGRRRGAERVEHLELRGGVRDMVLAAHDMGDAHVDIVDHRREKIEPRPVGAAHHRIAHRRRIEALGTADQIVPLDRGGMIEPETPVRADALGFEARTIGIGERERGAIIDRRQAAAEQDLALEIELLLGLIGRIDAACGGQLGETAFVEIETLRLARLAIGDEAEPGKVVADREHMLFARALAVGVVDPQQEPPALFARPHPVV